MGIMNHLRAGTKTRHEYVNNLPYFKALEHGELPISSYIGHLNFLAVVHGALEREIARIDHPIVKGVWRTEMARSQMLLDDLAQLKQRGKEEIPGEVMKAASELERKIALRRKEQPVSLLGYVYVLEGSSLGAQLFAPKIASNFNISPGPGILYYTGDGANVRKKWREFSARMDEAVQDPVEREKILDAAIEIFDSLAISLAALYPI